MSLTDESRERRIATWTTRKKAWEAKLAVATSTSATNVAKIMVDEAEGVLKRLETKEEIVQEEAAYEKQNIDTIVKKVKGDRKKRDLNTPLNEDESAGTIGL